MTYEWGYPCDEGDWGPDQAEGIQRVAGAHVLVNNGHTVDIFLIALPDLLKPPENPR